MAAHNMSTRHGHTVYDCLETGCVFVKPDVYPTWLPERTSGLYICQRHRVYHICQFKLHIRDCVFDATNRCRFTNCQYPQKYTSCQVTGVETCQDTTIPTDGKAHAVRLTLDDRTSEHPTHIYGKTAFRQGLKDYLQKHADWIPAIDEVLECPRTESNIHRLYYLFHQERKRILAKSKHAEVQNKHIADRFTEMALSLLEDKVVDQNRKLAIIERLGGNKKSQTFRKNINKLITADRVRSVNLLPTLVTQPTYVSKRQALLARQSKTGVNFWRSSIKPATCRRRTDSD